MDFLFECSTSYITSDRANERDIQLNTRRENPYLKYALFCLLYKQLINMQKFSGFFTCQKDIALPWN